MKRFRFTKTVVVSDAVLGKDASGRPLTGNRKFLAGQEIVEIELLVGCVSALLRMKQLEVVPPASKAAKQSEPAELATKQTDPVEAPEQPEPSADKPAKRK